MASEPQLDIIDFMPHRNLLLLFATAVIAYACYVRAEQNPYARYVAAGYSTIDRWALQDTPDQELFEGAMRGMVDVLRKSGDEHSAFVNQQRNSSFREELTQQFGGVGVRIRMLGKPSVPTVVGPPQPGTPAYHADIRSGDRILEINGQPSAGMTISDVLNLMRGPVGESLTLAIQHEGETASQETELTRATIIVDSIYGDLRDEEGNWIFRLEEDPRLGYVRITTFGDKTVAELTQVLADLTNADRGTPISALIIDVRDNHGGALDAAVDISDLFLRAGQTIVTTRGSDRVARDRFVSTGRGDYSKLELAILINQESASASEIVAACLQDYGRAIVIGQRTFGKGTVQRLFSHIEAGRSLLKLTTATYWRPSEQNIHRMPGDDESATWGVRPNPGYDVPQDEQDYLQWRKYRSRRDLFGEKLGGALAAQLDKEDGRLPESYVDPLLQRAVVHLQSRLTEGG
jgi:carboxyl-terminal processing protease